MLLSELLTADRVWVPLRGASKDDILRELVELAVPAGSGSAVEPVLSAAPDRELEIDTGIGGGVALPHGRTTLMDELVIAAGVAEPPVQYGSADALLAGLAVPLAGPESATSQHVKALRPISRLLGHGTLRDALRRGRGVDDFVRPVRESEAA
ncbi:MAG TPA: PTS sugar transporter subunit IIA [Gemmatimonadaceae bacterium]|nr:PTS sugar transporter subunit IIA [Gemmatimonadaceae bacterium]